jgi:hypothetical protein
MTDMLDHLAPRTQAPLRCGTHIAKNMPDIEACAMALTRIPANRADFDAARGTREFVIAKFLVLALGPPGFGKVPYNSKRSAGQKEDAGKPLYEAADDGRVRLFSFEKGKTNKDKGARVDAEESGGVLEPGLVLSFFLREDFWDPPKIMPAVSGDDVVGVGTLVAMQISSGNVEAAAKGYLLKLKKIKVLPATTDLGASLARLPGSEEEYDRRSAQSRNDFPAMKGGLDSSSDTRCFATTSMGPDACAFAHDGGFIISNARTHNSEGFRDDIFVSTDVCLRCFQLDDPTRALQFMNVALALDAVGAIMKTCSGNVLLSAEDVHPLVALTLVLDLNALLCLEALDAPDVRAFLRATDAANAEPLVARDLVVSKKDESVHWHSTKQVYATDAQTAQVGFTLYAADHCGPEGAPCAHGQLSSGCSGSYKKLCVLLTRAGATCRLFDLELRMADATSTRQKRKRPELVFESGDLYDTPDE